MLGALRNTATYKLEIEADLLPLEYKRKESLLKYGARICQIKGHPVKEHIQKCNGGYNLLSQRYKLSALDNLHKNLKSMDVNTQNMPNTPMTNKYT